MSWAGKLRRRALASLAALGALVAVVTATPLVSFWGGLLAGRWEDPRGDTLVVLGGAALEEGVLGYNTYWRCVYAVLAWREGAWSRVVLSGGGPGEPVAVAMQRFLVAHGVPAAAIELETSSASTRENALETSRLLAGRPGRIVLLTSDYHMFRARRAFAKAGLTVQPRPIPDSRKRGATPLTRWPAFLDLLGEIVKIGYYAARGWI